MNYKPTDAELRQIAQALDAASEDIQCSEQNTGYLCHTRSIQRLPLHLKDIAKCLILADVRSAGGNDAFPFSSMNLMRYEDRTRQWLATYSLLLAEYIRSDLCKR